MRSRNAQHELTFNASIKATDHLQPYDALLDQHAQHYFTNRPIKAVLKKLAKAIKRQPLSTRNTQMLSKINALITTPVQVLAVPHTLPIPHLKSTVSQKKHEITNEKEGQTGKSIHNKTELSRSKTKSSVIDPYMSEIRNLEGDRLQRVRLLMDKSKLKLQVDKKDSKVGSKIGSKAGSAKATIESGNKLPSIGLDDTRKHLLDDTRKHLLKRHKVKHNQLIEFINQKREEIRGHPPTDIIP